MASFRFHRGTLVESLSTSVFVETVRDVRLVVENHLNELNLTSNEQPMYIEFYGYDARIQKDLFSVRLKDYGMIGWIEDEPANKGELKL